MNRQTRSMGIVCGAMALGVVALAGGCESHQLGLGATGISASETLGGIDSSLPVPASTVGAAAETVLQRRGYVIVGRTVSEGSVTMRGRYPQGGMLPREATVSASGSGGSSTFSVTIGPFGDGAEAQASADAIGRTLGL